MRLFVIIILKCVVFQTTSSLQLFDYFVLFEQNNVYTFPHKYCSVSGNTINLSVFASNLQYSLRHYFHCKCWNRIFRDILNFMRKKLGDAFIPISTVEELMTYTNQVSACVNK